MSARSSIVIPAPARRAFGALQSMSPALAARLAERWFFTPPRRREPAEVEALLRSARRFTLRVDSRTLAGWGWGTGPVVYLMHGWGSRGGQLGAFAGPLVASGHRVVAFDAPGHGASGRGMSSMPEFARALRAVVDHHGAARAVIGHSMGGSAAALAATWGLAAERFVLLAPAANPAAFAGHFAAALGARAEVMARARANSERRLRFSWSVLDVCAAARRMSAPALIIHDRDDLVVPFADGAAIADAWPGARLLPTSGLGHRGVMRDPGVVEEVLRFVHVPAAAPALVSAPAPASEFVADPAPVSEPVAPSAPMSETEQLEYELFHRDSR